MKSVGMFEAKTQFSALIEAVGRGETILVTKNGKPVAQLGPAANQPPANSVSIASFCFGSNQDRGRFR